MTFQDIYESTMKYHRERFEAMLQRLLNGQDGSVYVSPEIKTKEELLRRLQQAHWEESIYRGQKAGTHALVTDDLPGGHKGMVHIADLPDDA